MPFRSIVRSIGKITDSKLLWDVLLGPTYNHRIVPAAGGMFQALVGMLSPLDENCRVLDVGCGPGHFTRMLSKANPRARITGIDYSPGQVRLARDWLERDPAPNCEFQQANAMDLPFQDKCFDRVVSLFSIKHWPDPLQGLREIHRVLKPRCRALVGEVNPEARPEAVDRFARDFTDTWWLWKLPYRLWLQHGVLPKGHTGTELEKLGLQAGFAESAHRSPGDWILVWVELGRP
jgi:ubiquinone/menaquinone biosynthesis C-methylase UbiE